MVNSVTSPRLALCGVIGRPAAFAMRQTRKRAADAAEIEDVRLHDVDGAHLDHVPPGRDLAVLLAAGHRDVERVGHLLGLLELPVEARLLEMLDAVVLQHAADLDRALRREAAIGVDQQRRLVAERLADRRHDLFGAARPFVDVVAVFGGDAELEGVEAEFVAQPLEPLRLGLPA